MDGGGHVGRRNTIAIALLFLPCIAWGVSPPSGDMVQQLPQGPDTYHPDLHGVRLRNFVASNAKGRHLDVPAHLIDIQDGTGGWLSPHPRGVPPFPVGIPSKLRNEVQLYYSAITGWLAVPVHWRLYGAAAGADGGSYIQFNPPDGPRAGWMVAEIASQCISCGPSAAAGLIPDTAHAYKKNYELVRPPLSITSPYAKLNPKPNVLQHPNPCSARLQYKASGKLIQGAVVLHENPDGTAQEGQDLYITLSENSSLSRFIVDSYLAVQMSDPFYCQGVNIPVGHK